MKNPFELTEKIQSEFDGASDRAAAIVAGAFLDEILREILEGFLIKNRRQKQTLFEGTGPLSSFSAKIDISFQLGLIGDWEMKSLHAVRKIRNEFAHRVDGICFSNQSIKDRCTNHEVPLRLVTPRLIPVSQATVPTITKANREDARAVFQELVLTLVHMLAARYCVTLSTRRTSPSDFGAAHEPLELMLAQIKRAQEELRHCITRTEDLEKKKPKGEVDDITTLQKNDLLIKLVEFMLVQIKVAHDPRGGRDADC